MTLAHAAGLALFPPAEPGRAIPVAPRKPATIGFIAS
jgi:hypothetical protein